MFGRDGSLGGVKFRKQWRQAQVHATFRLGITTYAPFSETRPGVRPKMDDYIDHIAYVSDLVGIDHVVIGSMRC
jgi:microsomal dipeptidase-like Zn-dependent dipeptidase